MKGSFGGVVPMKGDREKPQLEEIANTKSPSSFVAEGKNLTDRKQEKIPNKRIRSH